MPAPDSVVLETNLGNIQLELYWDHAPRVRPPFLILPKYMTYFKFNDRSRDACVPNPP
jgi:cyclophilin family peptidyl-prolyl cis-trans isomerase